MAKTRREEIKELQLEIIGEKEFKLAHDTILGLATCLEELAKRKEIPLTEHFMFMGLARKAWKGYEEHIILLKQYMDLRKEVGKS